MSETELNELRELAKASTNVVAWYAHSQEVRGPFCRWFTCSEVSPQYRKNVAATSDDCKFAAAAMNNLVPLLDEIDRLNRLLKPDPKNFETREE